MTDLPVASRIIWPGSFLVVLAAHAALALSWFWQAEDLLAGAGGKDLDVIGVVMLDLSALESRDVDHANLITPAPAGPVEEKEGSASPDQSEANKEAPDAGEKAPDVAVPKPDTDAVRPRLKPAPNTKPKLQQPSKREENSAKGGAAARGAAPTDKKTRAPVAASAGASQDYARLVSQALARTKPKGVGALGTTKIKFTIAASGRLSAIEVAESSGDRKLDQKALEAVRQAAFPQPPPGMTVSQLTYVIPYQFR